MSREELTRGLSFFQPVLVDPTPWSKCAVRACEDNVRGRGGDYCPTTFLHIPYAHPVSPNCAFVGNNTGAPPHALLYTPPLLHPLLPVSPTCEFVGSNGAAPGCAASDGEVD